MKALNTIQEVKKNTIVIREGFKTENGLGLGIFRLEDGTIILDETVGYEVEKQYDVSRWEAYKYGSLRAKFNLNDAN
jgi:hypothetical protein